MKNLNLIIATIEGILQDEEKLKSFMKDELRKIKQEYGTKRKTEIRNEITEIKIDNVMMIPKEDVIVVVTKDGYVKRVSLRSYSSVKDEATLIKENDYVIGLYEMNTLDTLLLFTNLGNYLYVPVHEIPDAKWKELGKHISNTISLKENETIIGSMPVYDFNKDINIVTFTKLGMIKKTKLSDYKLLRYSKPVNNIKLKDKDEVTNISFEPYNNVIITTSNGYSLIFDINEVPATGLKSAGVKSINLKDDYVTNGIIFNENMEYLSIFTDKGTAKRIKISELEKSVRARRGTMIIREVKTNPHKIVKTLIINSKQLLGIKNNNGINIIKNTELPIMDRYSTGSNIAKNIMDVFAIKNLENSNNLFATIKEEHTEKEISLEEVDNKILTIDDFLKDFNSL